MISYIVLILIIASTHFISALTGFGCTIIAMPFVISLIGISAAKSVLLVMGLIQPGYVLLKTFKHLNLKTCLIIIGISALGLPFGYLLYSKLPQQQLIMILGVLMVFAGGLGIAKLRGLEINNIPKLVGYLLLFAGGIIQGAFVSGGPLIVIYASIMLTDKQEFRATLSLLWIILNFATFIQSTLTGAYTPEVIKYTLINIPFLIAAIVYGNKLADRISKTTFEYILNIVLIVAGGITIFNQVSQLIK